MLISYKNALSFLQLALMLLCGLGFSISSWASNQYIRSGASGTTCVDWGANACNTLPTHLVRGNTYYIAGGDYSSYTFDTPESGKSVITIKKAIASDHGTDIGWQTSYGTTQAVFKRILRFDTGYYIFDGQIRNESNWFDGAAYGFQVYHNNNAEQLIIIGATNSSVASNVTIKNVFVNAQYKMVPANKTIAALALSTDTWAGSTPHTGLLFSKMFIRGTSNQWFLRNTDGAIVEYSASEGAQSTPANHGEVVNLYYTGANAIIRYNQWRDEFMDSGGTALVAITNPHNETANGLSFYGNVIWDFNTGDAAIGYQGYLSNNNKVYNNTFIRGIGFNSGTAWGSGKNNLVYNNLYIDCKSVSLDGTHDYNGFSDSNNRGESHAQINIPNSIFTHFTGNDFTLKSNTTSGLNLLSPFDKDMTGKTRATWSKGAFEYNIESPPLLTLQPPTHLRIQ